MIRNTLFFITQLFCVQAISQTSIIVDGEFDDWQNESQVFTDAVGDNANNGLDIRAVVWANDDKYVFCSLEIDEEINLQEGNSLELLIDADDNVSTGKMMFGRGVDLSYAFGSRSGWFYRNGDSTEVRQNNIGLVTAPTVSSKRFELAISKSAEMNGTPVFPGNTIRFSLREINANGDRFPETGMSTVAFSVDGRTPLPSYRLSKEEQDLRIVSYNVLRDGLLKPGQQEPMSRLLQAIEPDVIGFQEIYNHSSEEVAQRVESILPSKTGEQWYHGQVQPDIITISRFPIIDVDPIGTNGAFYIQLSAGDTLLLINAHPPCCSNNDGRQREFDAMMGYLRDSKTQGTIPNENPIVILGDMNLVGFSQQLRTMLEGDIIDTNTYGVKFSPDWDGSALDDAIPITSGKPMTFTWYSEGSSYNPGRLDFMVYAGSVMELTNAFVLFSSGLSSDSLNAYGLQSADSKTASDHLPLVADFRFPQKQPEGLEQGNLVPNKTIGKPEENGMRFEVGTDITSALNFRVVDLTGKELPFHATLDNPDEENEFSMNLSGLSSGGYVLKCLEAPELNLRFLWNE